MLSKSTKSVFNSVRTQQIFHYQSINLATCFGSFGHHQANSQTILNVPPVWFVRWPDDGSMSRNMLPDL